MPRREKAATVSAQNGIESDEGRVAKRQKIGVHEMGATAYRRQGGELVFK
jgi:hypothetical protein